MKRLILALVLWPSLAQAQTWDCSNFASLPQQGMNACSYEAWQQADRSLNAAYAAVLDRLGSGANSQALRRAQRAWIVYRDEACNLAGLPMRGGSGEPLLINTCRTRLTERRALDLWNFTTHF